MIASEASKGTKHSYLLLFSFAGLKTITLLSQTPVRRISTENHWPPTASILTLSTYIGHMIVSTVFRRKSVLFT